MLADAFLPPSAMTDRTSFVASVPKRELNLRIEGTLEPGLAFAVAGRNGLALALSIGLRTTRRVPFLRPA